ncbi:hypothetical protein [Clostridium rectalis]|uniref:hypothetical protein n=1 Tax=Clostridium rectalis TaxID=2040295 RepID=UPI000F641339|nr:hypothetical protein [Clostridium rectalis]
MNILYSYNTKSIKKHSKLAIASLILSFITILITVWSISPNYTEVLGSSLVSIFSASFWWLKTQKTLFDIVGLLQLLSMFTAIVISINELYKVNTKKIIPIISLTLMSLLILLSTK